MPKGLFDEIFVKKVVTLPRFYQEISKMRSCLWGCFVNNAETYFSHTPF